MSLHPRGSFVVCVFLLVTLVALPGPGVAASGGSTETTQVHFLALAESGIAAARGHWWNATLGWYDDSLTPKNPRKPLAYLWSAFPLFESVDAVAIADPTTANTAAVEQFAAGAE